MRGEMLKGHVELLILSALRSGPGHGYAIIRLLRDLSNGEIDLLEGSIYPALHRLEAGGLVSSSWSTEAGRKRRVYKLTARGRAALADQTREWRGFEHALNVVLESP
jgi:PadR family transcriptional regulator, regulatory protein PadR